MAQQLEQKNAPVPAKPKQTTSIVESAEQLIGSALSAVSLPAIPIIKKIEKLEHEVIDTAAAAATKAESWASARVKDVANFVKTALPSLLFSGLSAIYDFGSKLLGGGKDESEQTRHKVPHHCPPEKAERDPLAITHALERQADAAAEKAKEKKKYWAQYREDRKKKIIAQGSDKESPHYELVEKAAAELSPKFVDPALRMDLRMGLRTKQFKSEQIPFLVRLLKACSDEEKDAQLTGALKMPQLPSEKV